MAFLLQPEDRRQECPSPQADESNPRRDPPMGFSLNMYIIRKRPKSQEIICTKIFSGIRFFPLLTLARGSSVQDISIRAARACHDKLAEGHPVLPNQIPRATMSRHDALRRQKAQGKKKERRNVHPGGQMKIIPDKRTIPVDVWFIFFAALGVAYILLNKPLVFAAHNMQTVILALVFLASFCGVGAPFVALFKLDDRKGEAILHSAAIGIGVTGLFVFVLGMLGRTEPTLHALWVLSGLILFGFFLWKKWLPLKCRCDFKDPLTLLGVAILIPFLLQLLPPLTAPVVSSDSLQYQLLIPKIYQKMGKIGHIPFLVESNYPCLAQYIYLLVMNLASDTTCNALHLGIGLLVLFAMGRLMAWVHPTSNRWLGPALFFSMPVFVLTASWAWNDAFFVFFLLLCLLNLLAYHLADDKKGSVKHLLLAGLLAGLASWVKYTFFMVLLCLLPLIVIGLFRWKWKWRHLLWFFVPMLPLGMLTGIKNWLFTGNPLFPFLHRVFPSPHWSDAAASYFVTTLKRLEIQQWHWSTFFLFPYNLSLKPLFIDIHIGILPLALLPLLFFRGRDKGISFLRFFCLFYLLSWLFIQTGTRSLLTLLAVVLCLGVIELEQRIWKNPAFRKSLVFLLCIASLANLIITIVTNYHLTRPIPHFLGLESKEHYIRREVQSQAAYEWLNRNPRVRKVLLVGLHAPYYLQRDALFSSIVDPPIAQHLSRGMNDPRQLARKLAGLDVSHVVIRQDQYEEQNRRGLYSWSPAERKVFEDFIAGFCWPEVKSAEEKIYGVKPLPD
jgi:hypothetical protein